MQPFDSFAERIVRNGEYQAFCDAMQKVGGSYALKMLSNCISPSYDEKDDDYKIYLIWDGKVYCSKGDYDSVRKKLGLSHTDSTPWDHVSVGIEWIKEFMGRQWSRKDAYLI